MKMNIRNKWKNLIIFIFSLNYPLSLLALDHQEINCNDIPLIEKQYAHSHILIDLQPEAYRLMNLFFPEASHNHFEKGVKNIMYSFLTNFNVWLMKQIHDQSENLTYELSLIDNFERNPSKFEHFFDQSVKDFFENKKFVANIFTHTSKRLLHRLTEKEYEHIRSKKEETLLVFKSSSYKHLKGYNFRRLSRGFLSQMDPHKVHFTQQRIKDISEDFLIKKPSDHSEKLAPGIIKSALFSNCTDLYELYSKLLKEVRASLEKDQIYVNQRPSVKKGLSIPQTYDDFAQNDKELKQRKQNYLHVQLALQSKAINPYLYSNQRRFPSKITNPLSIEYTSYKKLSDSLEEEIKEVDRKINNLETSAIFNLIQTLTSKDNQSSFSKKGQPYLINDYLGVELKVLNNRVSVYKILDEHLAKKAHLKVGDIISEIKPTLNSSWHKVSSIFFLERFIVSGLENTQFSLRVKGKDATISSFEVIRNRSNHQKIAYSIQKIKRNGQEHKVGLIRIQFFYHDIFEKMLSALIELKEMGAESLLIDLTESPGGALVGTLPGLFIERGNLSKVDKSIYENPMFSHIFQISNSFLTWEKPLVILVNNKTASVAELFAGVLQYYKRALIVGSQKTFGKASIQTFISHRNNKDYVITEFLNFLPNGETFESKGIHSDIIFPTVGFFSEENNPYIMTWTEKSFASSDKETGAGIFWTALNSDMISKLKKKSNSRTNSSKEFEQLKNAFKQQLSVEAILREKKRGEKTKSLQEYYLNTENYLQRPDLREALEIATDVIDIVK